MELGWGIWRKRGSFAIFQICCSLSSQALGAWGADPSLGPGEKGLKKMEPGVGGVGWVCGCSWVKGP